MKFPPPLLSEQPRSMQAVLAIGLPVVGGAICGILLGLNEPIYLIASVIGILGGFFAGFDHLGAGAGARRGVVGGLLFGGAILIAHEIHGHEAKADLPHPAILLLVVTTALGAILGALGGRARQRRQPDATLPA